MRRSIFTAVAMLLVAFGAVAQEQDHSMTTMSVVAQEEHLAHLRELVASMSSHEQAIPQPASISSTAAVKNFTITAKSFNFTVSPLPFTVNQGDVVNITLTVPSNDSSSVGHGILMDTYIGNGLDCPRGQSKMFQFTATTSGFNGNFAFVCDIPSCGSGHSSMSGNFTVIKAANPAPAISSISPTSGSQSGGTAVTITGTGFLSGATVKFGGTPATNVSVPNGATITATTPAHAVGKVDVVVTNTDAQLATLAQSFTYATPIPTVSSIAPATGPTTGGTPVTITGTNFQSGATVTIGAQQAANVTVVSATSITALTPFGPTSGPLAVDVVVTNPDTTKVTATGAFTYSVPPLAVFSVTPNSALPSGASGAAPVVATIFGAGFTSAATVSVGGVAATSVQAIDPVTLQATFGPLPPGRSDVVVTVGATSVTLKGGFSWQNAPPKRRATKH